MILSIPANRIYFIRQTKLIATMRGGQQISYQGLPGPEDKDLDSECSEWEVLGPI
jgi:hypothetical protein